MTTTLAPPPVRELRPVTEARGLFGKRLVVAFQDPDTGFVSYERWEYRAVSEVFNESGTDYLRIATELNWWAWQTDPNPNKPPNCPRAKAWPAEFCWFEAE